MPTAVSWALVLACVCEVVACGDGFGSAPAPARVCTPGVGYSCVVRGCNGHRSCMSDGSGLTPCVCWRDNDPEDASMSLDDGSTGDDAGTDRPVFNAHD
ncbi:MAG: hypothetical protein ABW321_24720 [Polyangiales bacterium]